MEDLTLLAAAGAAGIAIAAALSLGGDGNEAAAPPRAAAGRQRRRRAARAASAAAAATDAADGDDAVQQGRSRPIVVAGRRGALVAARARFPQCERCACDDSASASAAGTTSCIARAHAAACFIGDAGAGATHIARRVAAALAGGDGAEISCSRSDSRDRSSASGVTAWTACSEGGDVGALLLDVHGGDDGASPSLARLAFALGDLLIVVGREALCNRQHIDRCLAIGRGVNAGGTAANAEVTTTVVIPAWTRRPTLIIVSNDRPVDECAACAASATELWGRDASYELETLYDGVLCLAVPSLRVGGPRARDAHDAAVRTIATMVDVVARERALSRRVGGFGFGFSFGGDERRGADAEGRGRGRSGSDDADSTRGVSVSTEQQRRARDVLRDLARCERETRALRAAGNLDGAAALLDRALGALPPPSRLSSEALSSARVPSVARRLHRSRLALLCALGRWGDARDATLGRELGDEMLRRPLPHPAGILALLPKLLREINHGRPVHIERLVRRAWRNALGATAPLHILGDGWESGEAEARVGALFASVLLHPRELSHRNRTVLFNEDVIVRFRAAKGMLLNLVARLVAAQLRNATTLHEALRWAQPTLQQHARRAYDTAARIARAHVPCVASLDHEAWLSSDGRDEAVVCLKACAQHGAMHTASRAVRRKHAPSTGVAAAVRRWLPGSSFLFSDDSSVTPHLAEWRGRHQPPSGLVMMDPRNDFASFFSTVKRLLHVSHLSCDGGSSNSASSFSLIEAFEDDVCAPLTAGDRVLGRVALTRRQRRLKSSSTASQTMPSSDDNASYFDGWCASCGVALVGEDEAGGGGESRPVVLKSSSRGGGGGGGVGESCCHIVALCVCGECADVLEGRAA